MRSVEIPFSNTLEDDAAPLYRAIRDGLPRPLLLWAHPQIGQRRLVEAAAEAAGLPFRVFEGHDLEGWDGFRDVTDSGHFREVSIEKFLAGGERADPGAFTLLPGSVLYLSGLNEAPTRLVEAVFEQVVGEGKLLNNPLPAEVRIVASAYPPDRTVAVELLGPVLARVWTESREPASLKQAVFPLADKVMGGCDHWAMLPSLVRFVAWARHRGLAEEVLRYLEDEDRSDPARAAATLHAALVRRAELFPQVASPRSFADLASLLVERRPYFSSRAVKDAIARSQTAEELRLWLRVHVTTWEPERWSEADSSLTLRGEPAFGSAWLRNLIEQVKAGTAAVGVDDVPTYAAYERRSLEMWATQELGDDVGHEFVERMTITERDVAHLR